MTYRWLEWRTRAKLSEIRRPHLLMHVNARLNETEEEAVYVAAQLHTLAVHANNVRGLTVWTEGMLNSDVLVQQGVHSARVQNKLEFL